MATTKKSTKTTKKSSTAKKLTSRKATRTKNVNTMTDISSDVSTSPKKRFSVRPKRMLGLVIIVAAFAGLLYYLRGLFVVAIVNGKPITRYELVRDLEKNYATQELDSVITKKLIYQEAAKRNIVVTDEEVQTQIDELDTQLKSQGTSIEQYMTFNGQTLEQLKDLIKLRKTVEALMQDKLAVSEDEVQKYYDDNKATFGEQKFEEVKGQITDSLVQNKLSSEFQTWIAGVKANSKIYYLVNF